MRAVPMISIIQKKHYGELVAILDVITIISVCVYHLDLWNGDSGLWIFVQHPQEEVL